jgi:UDPglucose 6-dehydrogenase
MISLQNKIAVVGLGKLGSCHAALLASKGYEVIGADINSRIVDDINLGKAPVIETGLQSLIDKAKGKLSATINTQEAVRNSHVTFIIVPTPSDNDGRFSIEYIRQAAVNIAQGLRDNPNYHVVVVTSTVMVNDTSSKFIPILENVSGKKIGVDFGVCYNPEFISLGRVVHDMLNPDVVLIGESDEKAGDIIEQVYKNIVDNSPYYARMNIINAELTKVSCNSYITLKISFANIITQICSNLKGCDAKAVLEALGYDSRIGHRFLKPGMAYGGPCLPRDNVAFSKIAEDVGVKAILAKATDMTNDEHTYFISQLVKRYLKCGNKVALLGLSYKPNTPSIDMSPAIALARSLINDNFPVYAYDPQAMENTKKEEVRINCAPNLNAAVKDAKIVVIATAWDEFKKFSPELIATDTYVIDCWGILNTKDFGDKLIQVGKYK